MEIILENAGKKYYREWIFRKVNQSFKSGSRSAILGPNGSGKSTLLQSVAGAIMLNEGKVIYQNGVNQIEDSKVYLHISFASPYLELIEEFTLEEIVNFHFSMKPAINGISSEEIMKLSGLHDKSRQTFKFFSSGMKQRVKLTLAVLSDTPVILLDEPCSNLDEVSVTWYASLIKSFGSKRTIIVASNNNQDEFSFCDQFYNMDSLKD